ncbi:hypothetical protein D3C76_1426250 [compost metagenome]
MVQHVPRSDKDDRHDPDRGWYAQRPADTEPAESIGHVGKAGIHRAAVGVHHGDAAQQQHHHQGRNKCLHLAFGNNHPGTGADRSPQCQCRRYGHHRVNFKAHDRCRYRTS